MNKLKFNSQICTSRSQSERLLDLGLKKETADMTLQTTLDVCYTISFQDAIEYFENRHLPPHPTILPAWSLHRLIEMMPTIITNEDYSLIFGVNATCVYYTDDEYAKTFKNFECDLYNCVVKCIEWLIKEGYFNKEYLEQ